MTLLERQKTIEYRGQGKSFGEIAKTLGISRNTVKSYCQRNTAATVNAEPLRESSDFPRVFPDEPGDAINRVIDGIPVTVRFAPCSASRDATPDAALRAMEKIYGETFRKQLAIGNEMRYDDATAPPCVL